MTPMAWYLIAATVAVMALVAGSNIVGGRQMRRVLAAFDAETEAAEPEPEPSWSESIGWDPAEQLAAIRRDVADELWRERMVADLTGPDPLPFLAELVNRNVLAIEPAPERELEGAKA